jgi:hypothetical protein
MCRRQTCPVILFCVIAILRLSGFEALKNDENVLVFYDKITNQLLHDRQVAQNMRVGSKIMILAAKYQEDLEQNNRIGYLKQNFSR